MAMRKASIVVELLDRVTGPARSVSKSILGIPKAVKAAGGGYSMDFGARMAGAIERNNAALDRARGRLFDAAAGAYMLRAALGGPIKAAIDMDAALTGVGLKAGASAAELETLRRAAITGSRATNQSASDLVAAVDYLVGMGVPLNDAIASLNAMGTASTASGASVQDMAAASYAALSNLKVPAGDMTAAFDAMAKAGKQGGFELRDMAQYFPSLGAAYGVFGRQGVGAVAELSAALQVIRADTGDASQAATNLANVLQKAYSPATVAKFKKAGIDLPKEMARAAKAGKDPMEALAEITDRALKGDLTKLGTLFEDAQAQAGIRSLITGMEDYERIKKDAMAAGGTNAADFASKMQTTQEKLNAARIAAENFGLSLGGLLLPPITRLLELLTPIIDRIAAWAEAHPKLTAGIAGTASALIGMRIAMAGLSFVGLMGRGGALAVLSWGFSAVSAAAGPVAGALTAVGGALAAITAPVWLAIAAAVAAVAAAGYALWRWWDRITSVLSGVGQALGEILAPAIEKVRPLLDWLAQIGHTIADGWNAAKAAISAVKDWLSGIFDRETLSEDDKAKAKQAGYDFVMAIWDGMKQVMSDLLGWFQAKMDALMAPVYALSDQVRSIFPGGKPGLMGGPSQAAGGLTGGGVAAPGRAHGGPVSRGGAYWVGENGPELITAGRSGYVHPTGTGGAGASVHIGDIHVHAPAGADPMEIAREVRRTLADTITDSLRGIHADTGMATY